jgi:hypothetical protein
MREMRWGNPRKRVVTILVGAGVLMLAIAIALLQLLGAPPTSSSEATARTATPASPRPTPSVIPTPTSTPPPVVETPVPAPAPQPVAEEEPPAAAPAPAPAPEADPPWWPPPGVTEFGWSDHDAFVQCPDWSGGQVVKTFTWTAVHATSVDLYVAMNDRDAQAAGGYQVVASGLPTSGSIGVPITCSEATVYYTVKIVAVKPGATRDAHMWGGIGL